MQIVVRRTRLNKNAEQEECKAKSRVIPSAAEESFSMHRRKISPLRSQARFGRNDTNENLTQKQKSTPEIRRTFLPYTFVMLSIDAAHSALDDYYQKLAALKALNKNSEQATRIAFSTLLETFSKSAGWELVLEDKIANGKIPDGALLDKLGLPRGHWEAKDTNDDLDKEIARKTKINYPLRNTIFEDTRRAVLFQNEREAARFDLTKREQLAALLTRFFNHTDEDIEQFQQAVAEFGNRIPVLAGALQKLISDEPGKNPAFASAFATFHELCKMSLNPQIAREAIEEMLVQHLLTERLFRTVLSDSEFVQRNVIAAEIERVIATLVSRSFNRREFLLSLDPFYKAIEREGAALSDWSEKQRFLNAVYERFFQSYSVGVADTMGIVYTPQPLVQWMCKSADAVLKAEFGRTLGERGVAILDPCTGTGNFIVNIVRHHVKGVDLKHKYAHDLFANEIMLLPYYIAGLNIEHEYWEKVRDYKPFDGLCFADTLDLQEINLFSEENTERIKREKLARLTVIIGNPPYNVGQKNENDNNKNRKYAELDKRIRESYARDSQATNKNALGDPYVKFFKWASERLNDEQGGVVIFVSNNSFVEQHAFDGMRKHLARDFERIYHLDFHGNVRKNPKLSGTTHNVFGIQVGVGITIAVKSPGASRFIKYFRVPEDWRAKEKLAWLAQTGDVNGIEWQTLSPNTKNAWITEGLRDDYESFLPLGSKEAKSAHGESETIFKTYGGGVKTNRDGWVYDFNRARLESDVRRFIENYNAEVERWQARDKTKTVSIDDFVSYDDKALKWDSTLKISFSRGKRGTFDETHIRNSLYRPFTKQFLYFDALLNNSLHLNHYFFPTLESETENVAIGITDVGSEKPFMALAANAILDLHLVGAGASTQCFPFYVYAEDGTHRVENITDWALEKFRAQYGDGVSKRAIFDYVYALLHHAEYRAHYAENLKRELPRVPLVQDAATFELLREAGAKLCALHLGYESTPEFPLTFEENADAPISWRVEKMKWLEGKSALRVNNWLTLSGFTPEMFSYKLGNRSALDWLVDQYQVKTDARSDLISDPNRDDDEEYIVRLIGRVAQVSIETARIVASLPPILLM